MKMDTTVDFNDDGFEDYFKNFVPQLERNIKYSQMENDFDDPTIDLNTLELAIPVPMQEKQTVSNQPLDSSLEELECLIKTLKNKSNYSKKLISIMISGLQQTLGPHSYQSFLRGQLPKTWIPIVKTNNKNCPYIEFIIKSAEADEPPDSQLTNFTLKHMAYGQYVLDFLAETAKANSSSMSLLVSTPKKSQSPQRQQQSHQQQSIKQKYQAPSVPNKSVPKQQQPSTSATTTTNTTTSSISRQHIKHPSSVNSSTKSSSNNNQNNSDSLNDSKRIQPPRACRLSLSSSFRQINYK